MMRLLLTMLMFITLPAYAENYLTADSIPPQALDAPYAQNSQEWKKELASVVATQKAATEPDLQAARAEASLKPEMIDPTLTREKFPATYALLDKVAADSEAIVTTAKNHFHTLRPFRAAPDQVKMLLDKAPPETSYAYPSGHTAVSAVLAGTLSKLEPAAAEKLRIRAAEVALHRIQVGVHYPQDLVGGINLAAEILANLEQSEKYRADFKAAQAEWPAGR